MSNDLAIHTKAGAIARNQPVTIMQPPSFEETMRTAQALATSGFFKDCRAPEQAFAKILFGQELGLGAAASLSQVFIVEGKPALSATLIGAQIKKSGRYDYRIKHSDDNGCVIDFFERGELLGDASFSMDDARRAGLAGKDNWKKYPKDMCRSRALTQGARAYCPDVFGGAVYTPDEIGADVVFDESGEIRTVTQEPAHPAKLAKPKAVTKNVSPQDADKAERLALIGGIYKMLGIETSGKDDPQHELVMTQVANALQLVDVPATWSDFALSDLRDVAGGTVPLIDPELEEGGEEA